MSPSSMLFVFPSIAVFFLSLHLLRLLKKRSSSSLESGPRGYPILGCLISFYKNKHRLLHWYTELLSSSPTQTIVVSRLGARRQVVTANADNVEHILKGNFGNYPKGEPFSELVGDLLGRGIFNADGELWHSQRKLASREFTVRLLRGAVVDAVEYEVESRLAPILAAAADGGAVVDMQDLLRRFAFDNICIISLGTDPASLNSESALAAAFDDAARICACRGAAPLPAVWKLKRRLGIGSERRLKENLAVVRGSIADLIAARKAEHLEGKPLGNDFLSRLISSGMEDSAVSDMVVSLIMAGRDTSSSALTWLFWCLSRHPEIEKKVVDEALSVAETLNYETLKELTWLEACLYESMRLYPPVVWDSKHAAEDDILPDGIRVFKGDRVTYFPYAMGRTEELWGKDAMEFKPTRWLDAEEREMVKVSVFKYPVFQGGPRICLGKEMAFVQMKFVAAALLRRFCLRPVSNAEPVFVPLLTAHMAGGLKVRVENRVL